MLQRVVRQLSEVVDPIVVVAGPVQEVPPLPPSIKMIRDREEGHGPLQGLLAGLQALVGKAEAAYLSSCDAPFLQPAFVRRLIDSLGEFAVCVPHVGGFHHPLAAIYRIHLIDAVQALLEAGKRRPVDLFAEVATRVLDEDDLRAADPTLQSLRNLNTPQEYEAALRDLAMLRA